MADNREKHPFDDESDWCEVCTYFSGEHAEHTLTPIQWTVVDHLLGLSTDEPYSDDYLADQIVPAILKAFKEIREPENDRAGRRNKKTWQILQFFEIDSPCSNGLSAPTGLRPA